MHVTPIALVVGFSLLCSCDADRQAAESVPTRRAERFESVIHAPRVTIGEVVDKASRFEGQTVRIDGNVSKMLNPRAIVLEAPGVLGTQSIMVLTREPATPMGWLLQSGQSAAAVGIVRTGNAASIERELGRTLEAEVERAIGNAPVVIASSVGRVHGENIDWTSPAAIQRRPDS